MENIQCKREKWAGETHTQCELSEKGVMKFSRISMYSTPDNLQAQQSKPGAVLTGQTSNYCLGLLIC